MEPSARPYDFLLDTYRTEILKIVGLWEACPEEHLDWRPHERSRTIRELMEHQVQSEGRWMREILGVDTGDPNPAENTKQAYIEKYRADAQERLSIMCDKGLDWWLEEVQFYDVRRLRVWVMLRRINHSTHHRGQLGVYLRLLDVPVPSVYGPTADTNGKVEYTIAA
jgi:uncharacterized damage-inducible protein DinB